MVILGKKIEYVPSFKYIFSLSRLTVIVSTVLIYLLLKEPIDQVLSDYLVSPFLSQMTEGIIQDISFAVIILFVIVLLFLRVINPRHYYKEISLSIPIALIIFINRFFEKWNYLELSCCEFLRYLDILLILPLIFIVFSCFRFKSIKEGRKDKSLGESLKFVQDLPLKYSSLQDYRENDDLGYFPYAITLAKKLSTYSFHTAFGVGVTGDWGSGKTTFINIVVEKLKAENTVIDFNPWLRADSSSIISDFFDALYDVLPWNKRYSRKSFDEYSSGIAKMSTTWSLLPENNLHDSKLENYYKDISDVFKGLKSKVFVVIDDLDRLEPSEIGTILKLIRNTASFPNLVYVVAYDKGYIVESLKSTGVVNGDQYIKKILQLEVNLPAYDKNILVSIFTKALVESNMQLGVEKFISKLKKNLETRKKMIFSEPRSSGQFIKNRYRSSLLEIFMMFINDPRDVIRFANGFFLNIDSIKKNVLLEDFFVIELIRFTYPKFYEYFYNNYQDILVLEGKNSGIEMYVLTITSTPVENKEEAVKYGSDKGKADKLYPLIKDYDIDDQRRIITGVNYLFGNRADLEDSELLKSIAYVGSFDRYFRYYLIDGDFDFTEIEKLRDEGSYSNTINYIDNYYDTYTTLVIMIDYYINIRNYNSQEDCKYLTKVNLYLFEKTNSEIYGGESYPLQPIASKIRGLVNCLDDENNSIGFLVDTFSKMDSCTAPFNILFAMVQGDIKINSQTISPANMDYLITFLTKRLFKCEVTYYELRFLLGSTYWLYANVNELDHRKEKIFSLWRKHLITDLCLVFNAFVYEEEARRGFYGFHIKTFESVFEDFDNLRKLADYNILTVEKKKVIDELEELQKEIKNNQSHEVKFPIWNECLEKNR